VAITLPVDSRRFSTVDLGKLQTLRQDRKGLNKNVHHLIPSVHFIYEMTLVSTVSEYISHHNIFLIRMG
jgi:hypothetical protein